MKLSPYVKDITGKRYGRLLVLEYAYTKPSGHTMWKCLCDPEYGGCGNIVIKSSGKLNEGMITSCGCFRREVVSKRFTTHSLSKNRLYHIWNQMIQRCYNPAKDNYKWYGGRGITVCDEWYQPDNKERSIHNFMNWAFSNGYHDPLPNQPKREWLTLERKDNDKGYSPDNCEWIPYHKQASHTHANRYIYDGEEELIYTDFDKKYKMGNSTRCYVHDGWSKNAIVYKALHPEKSIHRVHPYESKRLVDQSAEYVDKDGFIALIPKLPQPEEEKPD